MPRFSRTFLIRDVGVAFNALKKYQGKLPDQYAELADPVIADLEDLLYELESEEQAIEAAEEGKEE